MAVVEKPDMIGGMCLNTGTIPSKTMREAVLYLTGLDQREMYGQSYRVKDEVTIADLANRTRHVVSRENDVVRSQLTRNRVTILAGTGRFADPHTVEVDDGHGRVRTVTGDAIVIAVGTRHKQVSSLLQCGSVLSVAHHFGAHFIVLPDVVVLANPGNVRKHSTK